MSRARPTCAWVALVTALMVAPKSSPKISRQSFQLSGRAQREADPDRPRPARSTSRLSGRTIRAHLMVCP